MLRGTCISWKNASPASFRISIPASWPISVASDLGSHPHIAGRGKIPWWLAFKSPGTKDGKLLALLRCARSKTRIKLKGAAAVWFFQGQKPQFLLSYGVKSHHSSQWSFGISEPSTVLRSVKLTPGDEKVRRPWWSSKTSTIGCINVCFFHQPGSTKRTSGFP